MSESGVQHISNMAERHGLVLPEGPRLGILNGQRQALTSGRLSVRSEIPADFQEGFVSIFQPAIDLLGQLAAHRGFGFQALPHTADYWNKFKGQIVPHESITGMLSNFALELCAQSDMPRLAWSTLAKDNEDIVPFRVTAKFNANPTPVAQVLALSLVTASASDGGDAARRVRFKGAADRGYGRRAWEAKAATMPRRTSPVEGNKPDWLT